MAISIEPDGGTFVEGDVEGAYVDRLEFNDGTSLQIKRDTILVITGPNNCGKSQTLREVSLRTLRSPQFGPPTQVVTEECFLKYAGNVGRLVQKIVRHPHTKGNEGFITSHYNNSFNSIAQFVTFMASHPQIFGATAQELLTYMPTSDRLNEIRTTSGEVHQVFHSHMQFLPGQLRRLHEDESLEGRIYNVIRGVFGSGILVNRATFQDYKLHFIDKTEAESRTDKGTEAYARWFEQQPLLDQQGDGVRAFCAIVVTLMNNPKPLVIIDEPELFLHPPQIRELAKIIAREAPSKTQIIVATHSEEFVRGIIDFGNERVSLVRLKRQTSVAGEINALRRLDASEIGRLWRDPLLRTSDALASLFHEVAVIVEGDSDARFLRAVMDAIEPLITEKLPDIRFFHCGGKDRMGRIASALQAVGVNIICIGDIDLLDNKQKFIQLFENLGGNAEIIRSDLNQLHQHLSSKKSIVNASEAKQKIDAAFRDLDGNRPLPTRTINEMYDVLKSASPWSFLKSGGIQSIERGEPFNSLKRLIDASRAIGIIINEHGELESFCKSVGGRKDEWLATVLEKNLRDDDELETARKFVLELIETARKLKGPT